MGSGGTAVKGMQLSISNVLSIARHLQISTLLTKCDL